MINIMLESKNIEVKDKNKISDYNISKNNLLKKYTYNAPSDYKVKNIISI